MAKDCPDCQHITEILRRYLEARRKTAEEIGVILNSIGADTELQKLIAEEAQQIREEK